MKATLLILLWLTACAPDKGKLHYSLDGEPDVTQDPASAPDFSSVQKSILGPKCVECHKWAGDEAKVLSRIVPGDPDRSKLFRSVESGRMPKGAAPLSTRELEVLRAYISALRPLAQATR